MLPARLARGVGARQGRTAAQWNAVTSTTPSCRNAPTLPESPAASWRRGAAPASSAHLGDAIDGVAALGAILARPDLLDPPGGFNSDAPALLQAREEAPALLCGTPTLPVGLREFAAEVSWDLPNLAPGATSLLDVTVTGCRQGDLADAALASSTCFIELDAAAWTNNTVRVMARNISPSAIFDLSPATLSMAVTKRRIP